MAGTETGRLGLAVRIGLAISIPVGTIACCVAPAITQGKTMTPIDLINRAFELFKIIGPIGNNAAHQVLVALGPRITG